MTQDHIDKVRQHDAAIDELAKLKQEQMKLFRLAITEVQEKRQELIKQCDHKNPDGTSAIEGHFMFSSCKLCDYCDL